MKTHFNLLKWLVGVTALAALALKLLTIALATAAGGGIPLDLLARIPASVADLGAALLVFEVLRPRRPLQLAARSVILVAVSPVLFVASGIHGDRVAMAAVAAGAGGHAADGRATRSRVVHFGGALAGAPFAAWVPAVVWVRRRPRRVYAAVGLVLLTPLALGPAWSPRDLVWPAVFGYLGDAGWASIYAVAAGATLLWTSTWWGSGVPGTAGSTRRPCRPGRWPVSAWSPGRCWAPGRSSAGARSRSSRGRGRGRGWRRGAGSAGRVAACPRTARRPRRSRWGGGLAPPGGL